jgi:hypothetical protein
MPSALTSGVFVVKSGLQLGLNWFLDESSPLFCTPGTLNHLAVTLVLLCFVLFLELGVVAQW